MASGRWLLAALVLVLCMIPPFKITHISRPDNFQIGKSGDGSWWRRGNLQGTSDEPMSNCVHVCCFSLSSSINSPQLPSGQAGVTDVFPFSPPWFPLLFITRKV